MTESTRPPTADIKLANGRIVTHTRKPNGSQDATMADGGTMSEAEGREADELRAAIIKNSDIARRILAAGTNIAPPDRRWETEASTMSTNERNESREETYSNALVAAAAAYADAIAAAHKARAAAEVAANDTYNAV